MGIVDHAPSGPDVARQAELRIVNLQLRPNDVEPSEADVAAANYIVGHASGIHLPALIARALADARREGLEEAATAIAQLEHKWTTSAILVGFDRGRDAAVVWLRQRAAQEAGK